jgi:hypothetical protein
MEGKNHIERAVMSVPTWVEANSLRAQRDMRERCAEAAGTASVEVIEAFAARIAELERRNADLLRALEQATGVVSTG